VVLAPCGEVGHEAAVGVCRIDPGVAAHLLEVHGVDASQDCLISVSQRLNRR